MTKWKLVPIATNYLPIEQPNSSSKRNRHPTTIHPSSPLKKQAWNTTKTDDLFLSILFLDTWLYATIVSENLYFRPHYICTTTGSVPVLYTFTSLSTGQSSSTFIHDKSLAYRLLRANKKERFKEQ